MLIYIIIGNYSNYINHINTDSLAWKCSGGQDPYLLEAQMLFGGCMRNFEKK